MGAIDVCEGRLYALFDMASKARSLHLQSVQRPHSLIVLKGLEAASADLIAAVLRLAEDEVYPLANGRLVRMATSTRIVGVVTESDELRLPRLLTTFPLTVRVDELTAAEAVQLVAQRVGLTADAVSAYYRCFEQVRAVIAKMPRGERRLSIRLVRALGAQRAQCVCFRDFYVAAKRLASYSAAAAPTVAFLDLSECWTLHLSTETARGAAAKPIANCVSLGDQAVAYLNSPREIAIDARESHVTIGRTRLNTHIDNAP